MLNHDGTPHAPLPHHDLFMLWRFEPQLFHVGVQASPNSPTYALSALKCFQCSCVIHHVDDDTCNTGLCGCRILIVGGSHTAYSVAWACLNKVPALLLHCDALLTPHATLPYASYTVQCYNTMHYAAIQHHNRTVLQLRALCSNTAPYALTVLQLLCEHRLSTDAFY